MKCEPNCGIKLPIVFEVWNELGRPKSFKWISLGFHAILLNKEEIFFFYLIISWTTDRSILIRVKSQKTHFFIIRFYSQPFTTDSKMIDLRFFKICFFSTYQGQFGVFSVPHIKWNVLNEWTVFFFNLRQNIVFLWK